VLTLVSSLSTITFVTTGDNVKLAFAAKKHGSSTNNGGASGSNNGGGSSDNGGGSTATGGSDNSNGVGGGADTSSTPPPPPPPATQQTCPDGSTPDINGNCPTTPTPPANEATPPATSPQTAPQTAAPSGNETGTTPTGGGAATPAAPSATPLSNQTAAPQTVTPQTLTPQTCPPLPIDANGRCPGVDMRGGGLGLPPPPNTCPPLPIDANGNCPGVDMRGGGLGLPPPPGPQPTQEGNGVFRLPTVQPLPNTGTIAPICPSGSHLVLNKCVVDNAQCPSGTTQDGDLCTPSRPARCAAPTTAEEAAARAAQASTGEGVVCPNPDGTCPPKYLQDADGDCVGVLPGTTKGAGGGFIQMLPQKPQP
jgi:hypothetical protein